MAKKIAVLVRERQSEALRMAVGITLMDDSISIFVLDGDVEVTEENTLNLETAEMMEMELFSNHSGNNGFTAISNEQLAHKLLEYDHIIPY
jgi:hypothetical protein